jgi:hypothetical protein
VIGAAPPAGGCEESPPVFGSHHGRRGAGGPQRLDTEIARLRLGSTLREAATAVPGHARTIRPWILGVACCREEQR